MQDFTLAKAGRALWQVLAVVLVVALCFSVMFQQTTTSFAAENDEETPTLEVIVVPDPNNTTEGSEENPGGDGQAGAPVEPGLGFSEEYDVIFFSDSSIAQSGGRMVSPRSYSSSTTENYYDQLDNHQKEIYNALKTQLLNASSDSLTFDIACSYTMPISGSSPDANDLVNWNTQTNRLTQGALDALMYDYPEIYWVNIDTPLTYAAVYRTNTNPMSIPKIEYYVVAHSETSTSEKNVILNAISSAAATAKSAGSSRYDKVKAAHDLVASKIDYNFYSTDNRDHSIAGFYDGSGVCESYAKAFKLILDELEIPCVLVSGVGGTSGSTEDHMWNYVKMEDGKWYAVDVTWDDQTTLLYDYFLVGSSTVSSYFNNTTFNSTHISDGNFSGSTNTKIFTYPNLNPTAYTPGSSTPDPTPTPQDPNYTVTPAANSKGWHNAFPIIITPTGENGYTTVSLSSSGPFTSTVTVGSGDTASTSVDLYFDDGLGNISSPFTFTYSIDTVAPVIVDASQSGNYLTVNATDSLSGVDTIVVTNPSGGELRQYGSNQFRITTSGTHTITVTDKAGNTTTDTEELTYTPTSSGSGSSSGGGISGFSRGNSSRGTTSTPSFGSGTGTSNDSGSSSQSTASSAGVITSQDAVSATQRALTSMAANGQNTAVVQVKNPSSISLEAMQEMVKAAGSYGVQLNADTTNESGNQVLVRLSINPAQATKNISLTASTTSGRAQSVKTFFQTWFSNRVTVVSLGQRESFGAPVEMAVYVGTEFNASNMVIYAYDSTNNTYQRLQANAWMDASGYVHFTTTYGGDIVISDGVLTSK